MVDSVLAQAILGQRAPDIVGSFKRGREEARQEQVRTLAGEALKAGGGSSLEELKGLDPQIALGIGEALRAQSANDISEFVRDAGIGLRMLKKGNTQGFMQFAQQRSNILKQQGRDTTQTDRVHDLVAAGQPEQAIQELQAFDAALSRAKGLTALEREFAFLTEGLSEEDDLRARRNRLGLDARAVSRRTPEEEGEIVLRREQAKAATKLSRENLDLLQSASKSIGNIDDAIRAIDQGAQTGAIERFLPNVRAASIELRNIGDRMGLDIVGSTTFGALSESELEFAKSTALPTGLDEKALRKWLVRKKAAQQKLASELRAAAIFFGKGGSIADFLERQGGRAPAARDEAAPARNGTAPAQQRNIEVDF